MVKNGAKWKSNSLNKRLLYDAIHFHLCDIFSDICHQINSTASDKGTTMQGKKDKFFGGA